MIRMGTPLRMALRMATTVTSHVAGRVGKAAKAAKAGKAGTSSTGASITTIITMMATVGVRHHVGVRPTGALHRATSMAVAGRARVPEHAISGIICM